MVPSSELLSETPGYAFELLLKLRGIPERTLKELERGHQVKDFDESWLSICLRLICSDQCDC